MLNNLLCLLLLLTPWWAAGQTTDNFPPPTTPPSITALKVEGNIIVDGNLAEADWQTATSVTNFFRVEPRQGGVYRYPTFVKVRYDEKNLYFGVFARDSLGKKGVRVQDMRRDFSWGENDIFGIQLDPQNLKQYCVSFQTTPYRSQRDLQNFNDTNTDNDWNALWKVRTSRTDTGYYAEFAIPFKSLRYDRADEDVSWGITFNRLARRDYEQTVYPAIPQSLSPYRMTYAAQLKGLELPKPGTNLRIEPYALYQYNSFDRRGRWNFRFSWEYQPLSFLYLVFNDARINELDVPFQEQQVVTKLTFTKQI